MHSCRSTSKLPHTIRKQVSLKPTTTQTRTMAFFPRELYGGNSGLTPLFRLLDDFDTYSRQSHPQRHHRHHVPTFQPRFDVREVEGAYELHGELAGLNKKDVQIEFTDPQTLVVRGRVERSYTAGTPPADLAEGTEMSGAIAEDAEQGATTPTKKDHQATVEDESYDVIDTPATTVAEVEKAEPEKESKPADKSKYWVSERSIGEFSRTFSFAQRIEQDGVSAKLENGILTVRVPKSPKHEARRIDIV
jgi:HSP20 family molecular chaperone IbpA